MSSSSSVQSHIMLSMRRSIILMDITLNVLKQDKSDRMDGEKKTLGRNQTRSLSFFRQVCFYKSPLVFRRTSGVRSRTWSSTITRSCRRWRRDTRRERRRWTSRRTACWSVCTASFCAAGEPWTRPNS